MAHLWARWLCNPCRLGDPHRFTAGGRIRSGPLVGKVAMCPLPPRGSPPLQSGGQNQKWPTSGQGGYVTPAASGIPSASERGAESEVAHLWARWLRNPCRLGDPLRFRARDKIRSGPQVHPSTWYPLKFRRLAWHKWLFGLQSRRNYSHYASFWKDECPPRPCPHCHL